MSVPHLASYAAWREARAQAQPPDAMPVISVITVTLNSGATLERTIQSVQGQTFPGIEHILVDGGSRDNTLDIVRRLARPQDFWLSEADGGISDAFNKGIAMARGRYIQILNADDWLSKNQIRSAVRTLETSGADFAFGDLVFYEAGRSSFFYVGDPQYERVIDRRMPSVGQTTMLVRHETFERIGLFDPAYRLAMDYDWLLRLHRAGGRGAYSPEILGHMTHEGASNRNYLKTIREVRAITVAHGRNRTVAAAEAQLRILKTAAGQPVKRHLLPVYRLVRRALNPAYRPTPTPLQEYPALDF